MSEDRTFVTTEAGGAMGEYQIRALTSQTWDAFADLCARNNGAGFGGCWCTWFHNATMAKRRACGGSDWRGYKERLVREGGAHAALVFEKETAVGWCQYGRPRGTTRHHPSQGGRI